MKTSRNIAIGLGVVLLAVIALWVWKLSTVMPEKGVGVPVVQGFDPKNGTYKIDGQVVTLKDGLSEVPAAPGSASKIITRYFGNEVRHDFDGDGRDDVAFLLTQTTGGSGTFYYLVAALNTTQGLVGSQGIFLGDRIAPQTTNMDEKNKNVVVVNYATRNPGEPFTTQPSLGKSEWFLLDTKTMQWGEVVQNFEGEADTAKMSLGMKTWNWVSTTYNNGTKIVARDPKKFALTFKKDGTFSASTDCNSLGGNYVTSGKKITFDKMFSTEMFCEGSQEQDFQKTLSEAQSYHFTSKGELVLDLKMDSGAAVFR